MANHVFTNFILFLKGDGVKGEVIMKYLLAQVANDLILSLSSNVTQSNTNM